MANINEMKSRIKIYRQNYTSNGFGGNILTWTEVDEVWCKITPLNSKEEIAYKQIYATASYKINMRYRPDVNNDFRLYYGHRYYNILSVVDLNNLRDELEIVCEVSHSEQ